MHRSLVYSRLGLTGLAGRVAFFFIFMFFFFLSRPLQIEPWFQTETSEQMMMATTMMMNAAALQAKPSTASASRKQLSAR